MARRAIPLLLVLVAAWGCENGDDAPEPAPGAAAAVEEGLSREEIQERARPMSPEQAESLGIIDSITRIASPAGPDSALIGPDSLIPPDTMDQ